MIVGKISRHFYLLCFLSFLMNCGVEVGNPHDDEEGEPVASFSVEIADAPIDDLKNIYLNIDAIGLITQAQTLYYLDTGENLGDSIDVLSLQDGITKVLAPAQSIPIGEYSGYLLQLNSEIGFVVNNDGEELDLRIQGNSGKHIIVPGNISVNEAQTVILHLDLRQSIRRAQDGSYILKPVIQAIRRDRATVLTGEISNIDRGLICAYLNEEEETDELSLNTVTRRRPPKDPTPPGTDMGRLPEHITATKPNAGKRPNLPNKLINICADAFTGIRLRGGKFRFHYLIPGTYNLRVFIDKDTYYDIDSTYTLKAGERVNIGAIDL